MFYLGKFTQELDISHSDLITTLGPILELDNTLSSVDAQQETSRALVVAVDDHDAVALLWQQWLEVVEANVYRLVDVFDVQWALTAVDAANDANGTA